MGWQKRLVLKIKAKEKRKERMRQSGPFRVSFLVRQGWIENNREVTDD
jgi:hypothetical protein